MIDYHSFCQINNLHEQQGLSVSQIAREVSLNRATVTHWLAQDKWRPDKPSNRPSKLAPFRGYIEYYLSEDPRVSAVSVHQRLMKLGFDGKLSIVRDYLHKRRQYFKLQIDFINNSSLDGLENQETVQEVGYIWVLKLIQGRISKIELEKRFLGKLDRESIHKLHDIIINKPLRFRNRALTIFLYLGNCSQNSISRFLFINRGSVKHYIDIYREEGVDSLFTRESKEVKKHEEPEYKDALFKILHAPPSSYNINRTTWKLDDLKRIMASEGFGLCKDGIRMIIKNAGYTVRKAKKVLTSNDPNYQKKLEKVTAILSNLGPKEKFFSVDEYGPFAVKMQGGKSLVGPGEIKTIPQHQKSKGSLIFTAALELSTNQVTHFYSNKKDTEEMVKLIETLIKEYAKEDYLYFSWDAASWHSSKLLYEKVREISRNKTDEKHKIPTIKFVPLPSRAQFLNIIESIFSGMSRAIIHNSDDQSLEDAMNAIDRYFAARKRL